MREADQNGREIVFVGPDDGLFRELCSIASVEGLGLGKVEDPKELAARAAVRHPGAILVDVDELESVLKDLRRDPDGLPLVVGMARSLPSSNDRLAHENEIQDLIELPLDPLRARLAIRRVGQAIQTALARRTLTLRAKTYHGQWIKLNQIGIALSTIHDLGQLLDFILRKCREITSADSGSLYLKEFSPAPGGDGRGHTILRFKVAQNDSKFIPFKEWTMPAHKQSISGYVALEGEVVQIDDVYNLPADTPFRFDSSFDRTSGYRTRSMLVVPMRNHRDEIIGVIQLINKKREWSDLLKTGSDAEGSVIPFDRDDREMAKSLASQAGVSVENARLVEDLRIAMGQLKEANQELKRAHDKIEELFESFVHTVTRAVEARDNALSGHIERMALYALNVARAINEVKEGPLAQLKFSAVELKAIQYGAILHDIGKIGVREEILWKGTRLKPEKMEAVRYRFRAFQERLREQASRRQIKYILDNPRSTPSSEFFREVERELDDQIRALDEDLAYLEATNRLGFLSDQDLAHLNRVREKRLVFTTEEVDLISAEEYEHLSVRKGNLTPREWVEMKRHVKFTYELLNEIPWEGDLRLVPEIAGSHHEKRDGTGYHRGLKGDEIHVGGQIVAMVDIYEALTASDRPYKKQFTREEALAVLQECGCTNWLNPHLVDLFIAKRLWEIDLPERLRAPADRVAAVPPPSAPPSAPPSSTAAPSAPASTPGR